MWRLDSGARTFLPRLQGALTAIHPAPADPACYILTQADNTIRMVRAPGSGSSALPSALSFARLLPAAMSWRSADPWQRLHASASPGIALTGHETSLCKHKILNNLSVCR